ncbi:MAG: DUF2169 domain-containing protein [Candidatus Thiodiazotropha sp.]|jgi:hypothetical protein
MQNTIPNQLPSAEIPEVRNFATSPGQYYQTVDPYDVVFHVIVVRVTYDMRMCSSDGVPRKAKKQQPLAVEDRFSGAMNLSSLIWESDFAPYKPKCDILLLNGVAYAPNRQPSEGWPVGIAFGDMEKKIYVTGKRSVRKALVGWKLTQPEKILSLPLMYEYAFGGVNRYPEAVNKTDEYKIHEVFLNNPAGCGFVDSKWLSMAKPDQFQAPQLEVLDEHYNGQQTNYPVAGFGPLARSWLPRSSLAGTYDEKWKSERWPGLPIDHDYRYWNCAPADQQIDFPTGGEEIGLLNLHPDIQRIYLRLPKYRYISVIRLQSGPMLRKNFNLDTIGIDMESRELHCLYRVTVPSDIEVRVLEVHEDVPGEGGDG